MSQVPIYMDDLPLISQVYCTRECLLFKTLDDTLIFRPLHKIYEDTDITVIEGTVVDITSSPDDIMFITEFGEIWGLGDNMFGQIGVKEIKVTNPTKIIGIEHPRVLSKGGWHKFIITDDVAYCLGNNEFDQLGVKRNTFGRCLRTPQQIPKEYLSYVAMPSKSRIKSAASRK